MTDSQKEALTLGTKESMGTRIGFSRTEKKYEWKDHVIFMGILLTMAVWVNRGIEIKELYMDSLYFWSCYGEQSFLQYVSPVGNTRFRFLYYLAAWLEMVVVRNRVGWFVPFNILLNAAVSWSMYFIGQRLSGAKGVGFPYGPTSLVSRMAYYQIGQALGLTEIMVLWMVVTILWYLFRYPNGEDSHVYFYLSYVLYFEVCFVYERYMALFPPLLLVLLSRRNRRLQGWGADLLSFLLVQITRAFTIGSILPAGIGGTQVADIFSPAGTFKYALNQIVYAFGINAGLEHPNGCPWGQSLLAMKGLMLLADACIVVIVLAFVVKLVGEKRKDCRVRMLKNSTLFILFTGLCTASSSAIIRVEMRWMYVSLVPALLLLVYMHGRLAEGAKPELYLKRLWFQGAALACYVVFMLPVELYYQADYPKLYLQPNQLRYDSLVEKAYGRYGDGIFGKTIYTIGDSYKMSGFTTRTFFEVFGREQAAEGTRVEFVKSIRDIGLVDDRTLVLQEDPGHEGLQGITEIVREMRLQMDYGYYGDGQMNKHASLTIMAGETGAIDLEVVHPGIMSGGEAARITKDREEPCCLPVWSNVVDTTIQAEP